MVIPIFVDEETGDIQGYMSVQQAAEIWNVDEVLIRVWVKRGKLKVLKIGASIYIKDGTPKPNPKPRGRKPRIQNTSLSEG